MASKRVLTPSKEENGAKMVSKKFKQHPGFPNDELKNFEWDDELEFDLAVNSLLESQESVEPRETINSLDLTRWLRCEVEQVERLPNFDLKIKVKKPAELRENEPETAMCHLQAPWSSLRLAVGDTVSLLATWQPSLNAFSVSKEQGFCVTHPDFLISGTTVTGSLFCRRKTVLQERFRGLDAGSSIMVIGTLVHELLQKVLLQKLSSKESIQSVVNEMLQSSALVHHLYASNLSQAEADMELNKFIDPIYSFVSHYIEGETPAALAKDLYRGHIQEICDIEENLWVPQLGLKGKVDVSVGVKNAQKHEEIIPLEIKTGRASFSMEHKGQLLLYQLMLSAQGRDTRSGLLLYLKDGVLKEVPTGRNEQRDLILLRNDLAHWLSRQVAIPAERNDPLEQFQLPEPIYHHSACANCVYNTICSSFAQRDSQLKLSESHPLRNLMPQLLAHLSPQDQDYVQHWCGLLALEEQHNRQSSQLSSLWTDNPQKRQQQGRAIAGLQLVEKQKIFFVEGRYQQCLELNKEADASVNLTIGGFDMGEYIIVSSSSRLAIASGFITSLESRRLVLRLERDLSKLYAGESFVVDKYESQNFSIFNYTNLGLLLTEGERFRELREIVVAKRLPEHHKVLPRIILSKGSGMLSQLNKVQKAAALRALTTSSHLLIKGLPGTGKTQTLVSLVRLLHLLGKSVIITAQTHSAVDNLLLRLLPFNLPLMRLGSSSRTHPQLEEISETWLTRNCNTVEELSAALGQPSIVGVTCLGSGHALFKYKHFDYCIVDEATQVLQPTVLRPLSYCSKFILVGDPEQLPPVIRSREARQRGADETLFQRLDSEQTTAVLSLQYRMNKTITQLANKLTYEGKLQCASDDVSNARLRLEPLHQAPKWVQRVLKTHLEQAVVLVNTGDCLARGHELIHTSQKLVATCSSIEQTYGEQGEQIRNSSRRRFSKYTNNCEAVIVMHLLRHLLQSGFQFSRIGVIAPYRAQVELLKKLSVKLNPQLECNTVDQYQGRDKDLIIYSCSKTGSRASNMERSRDSEILEDQRRLTVAITRAKHKLIVLGDVQCLEQYAPFRKLFEHIPKRCRLELEEGHMDFSWQHLQKELDF
ncbi:hypothetical protein KR018_008815 [Drosophila ironensis]|nr:hypothetical protein KR018_008815 [Drosophila ironensis]